MNCLLLLLAGLVLGREEVFSASILTSKVTPEENIKTNLIGHEKDLISELTPPVLEAYNYYNLQSSKLELETALGDFVVEIHRKYLKILTTGLPAQKIKLNQVETEGIQKLSLSVAELLNSSRLASQAPENNAGSLEWRELNPVIILRNSDISLQFVSNSDAKPNATETTEKNRRILWDFLGKYAKNIFEEKLKKLKMSNKFAEVVDLPAGQSDSSPFEKFVNILWRIMKFSVNYAETAFNNWTTSLPNFTRPDVEKKTRTINAAIFAFEVPSSLHKFPSQEFQFQRKDIDSVLYGRGVI